MKHWFAFLSLLTAASISWGQTDNGYAEWKKQQQAVYGAYKDSVRTAYDAFRKQANADYAKFKEEHCVRVKVQPALKPEPVPKPPRPVVASPDRLPSSDPVPYKDVIPVKVPLPDRDIPLPVIETPEPQPVLHTFHFYGAACSVELNQNQRFRLKDISLESLSAAWTGLSTEAFDPLLRDCLQTRNSLGLDDWGYIDFVRTLTRTFFGSETNEAVLMQQYLLLNSGMMVRLCFVNENRLVLVVPFQEKIIGYPFYYADEVQYFVLQSVTEEDDFVLYKEGFDNEQQPTILMPNLPNLPIQKSEPRTFASKKYPSMKVSIGVNKNLIDLMNGRPWHQALWNYYAEAGLSNEVKDVLYPVLRKQIIGKSQLAACNILLDFVQQGFNYATDKEQFGKERSLFADESFYYHYNDCEDRSILYSVLVHDLLGLDVVLLHFKHHVATAVHFTEKVDGDYLFIEDKLYVVCDPTYIGASVGMAMPESKEEGALKEVWSISYKN